MNDVVSKFDRNFDQTSTPQVSKFGRSLVEVWSKLGRSLVAVWCRRLVDMLSNLLCVSLIYWANFDQTSTLGVSKFGRSLVEVWSKFGRSLVEVWSKFGRSLVEVSTLGVSKFGIIDDDRNNQKNKLFVEKINSICVCMK